tara:strand:- start:2055 stop:2267 length:213 start_codon:yes stop_codon:yes gene_type:complete
MLMKGDLVRLPQYCRVFSSSEESFRVRVLKEPKIAIVLNVGNDKSTILLENATWAVSTKDMQLYGGRNVC